jgi:hypothetical protein
MIEHWILRDLSRFRRALSFAALFADFVASLCREAPPDSEEHAKHAPRTMNLVFLVKVELLLRLILRSRALARRLEGWKQALVAHPSRRGQEAAPQDEVLGPAVHQH